MSTNARAELTVASWNLHEGVPAASSRIGQVETVDQVTELINAHKIDIAAFQEIGFSDNGDCESLNAVRKATSLTHTAAWPMHGSSFCRDRLSGIAIASRYPLHEVGRHTLPNPNLRTRIDGTEIMSHDKGMISAKTQWADLELHIVTLHSFPFYLFGREAQEHEFEPVWKAMNSYLTDMGDGPLIVCGDFNTPNRGLLLDKSGQRLQSALLGKTTYRGISSDDVLYSSDFTVQEIRIIENFSDHEMCAVDFVTHDR